MRHLVFVTVWMIVWYAGWNDFGYSLHFHGASHLILFVRTERKVCVILCDH
jgi:hypothetical protein